jgi:RNA polymerase sigma-70 factor (ECF subfamily)
MERYAAGDDQAFSELYDALAPSLFDFLRGELPEEPRAEEVLTQTLLTIHGARGRFLAGADVVPWAFAIARCLLLDSARRGGKSTTPSPPAPFAPNAAASLSAARSRTAPQR